MADGTLCGEDFDRNILEFMQVSDSLKDGWELQRVKNHSQQFCTFLVKRNTLRVLDVDGATSARRLLEIKHWTTSEDIGNDERRMKEEEDEAGSVIEDVVLNQPDVQTAGALCRFDYHIVFSSSYSVPTLYFSACHEDGKLLSLDEVWRSVPSHHQERLQNERWSFITQQEHPILGRPFFQLHPCHTADLMKNLLKTNDGTFSASHQNYLVTWLSSVGPVVGLSLPLEFAKLCKGT
ncbi:ubiquitin-like-conjugating enzyme ATG10 [Asterias amurensis]|uniref:ubiquitin-like-conjugating enzyme ATG10 n=1 Tax=Asterias amurensis TaxID=7602 RepID=UPI003AB51106